MEEKEPLDDDLQEEMRRHHMAYGRHLHVLEVGPAQNKKRIGDKSFGRKPSANTSPQQEDQTMATTTHESHESGTKKNHNVQEVWSEEDVKKAEHMLRMITDIHKAAEETRSPWSKSSLLKVGVYAGTTAAVLGGGTALIRLIWPAAVVTAPLKPTLVVK